MDSATLAFAFSKMQMIDELELIDNYKQLFFVEFLEFLGRLAYLTWYEQQDEPLEVKLWRLLAALFGVFGEKVKGVEIGDEVDSESDYEDEFASNLLQEKHPEEPYAGFGILKNSYGHEDNGDKLSRSMTNVGKNYQANPFAVNRVNEEVEGQVAAGEVELE